MPTRVCDIAFRYIRQDNAYSEELQEGDFLE